MPITAQSIIKEVQRSLNDYAGNRTPASDLVPLLNQAQRVIQTFRPDSTAAISPFDLVPGFKQSIPANASSLMDVMANTTGTLGRITKANLPLIDAYEPNWRSMPQTREIVHFMYDIDTPRTFYVYPPAIAGAQVELKASSYPIDVPAPTGAGIVWNSVTGAISLGDEFEQALIALTLCFALRSDLEGLGNVALADGYLQKASSLLGVQLTTATAVVAKN